MSNINVFAIGASRNIGYYAAIRLLDRGATITFLLRSPSVFDGDEAIQKYVKSGKARLVKGDAMNAEDVLRGWKTARSEDNSQVDVVLFTIGGAPHFTITKGIVLDPPNICTKAFLNVLSTLPTDLRTPTSQPKFIIVSAYGATHSSHSSVPLVLKPMYGLLSGPHADKLALERVVAHCAGQDWREAEPRKDLLSREELSDPTLLPAGELRRYIIVRPALLTDGPCKADKGGEYRATVDDLKGSYTVSRRDVAHFIVEKALKNWDEWQGKAVTIAY